MRTSRQTALALPILGLLLLQTDVVGAKAEAQEGQKAPGPVISLFAGGVSGAALWMVDIDASGVARVRVVGGRPPRKSMRQLSDTEYARLRLLVDALPTDKPRYHFGEGPIDAAMNFGLIVGTGKEAHQYSLVEGLDEEDVARPEVKRILELLHFLYGLVGSSSALPPPHLRGVRPPK
jgi:hypothetical protein